ncbi:MAG: hypothetical protein GDA36_04020 [Rhodobacteraceae bacterium]|nr:hypothetical protein [Paracoccaceae bacterium]
MNRLATMIAALVLGTGAAADWYEDSYQADIVEELACSGNRALYEDARRIARRIQDPVYRLDTYEALAECADPEWDLEPLPPDRPAANTFNQQIIVPGYPVPRPPPRGYDLTGCTLIRRVGSQIERWDCGTCIYKRTGSVERWDCD